MLLKVLNKHPRPIRDYMPKGRKSLKRGRLMKLNKGDSQWSNTLWDYMKINAIQSLT